MRIIRQASELAAAPRKVCVAIGVFDGVHLGHQQVIRQTITDARQHSAMGVAITFDRHPSAVVSPERAPALIYSLPQKLRVIDSLGADAILLIEFNQAFSEQSAETFIRGLVKDFGHIHSVCVGSNFTFGHKRAGNVALLKSLGQELRFAVHGLAAVSLDGKTVSSTRIREAIRHGNLDAASQMLGRAYSVSGNVIPGDQLGRQLGFPTANLDITQLTLPPNGVYAVLALVKGSTHQAVLNIGHRPTLERSEPELRAEVHLLDFSHDLYGQEVELTFVEMLRPEQKFLSIDELKEQIERDITKAREVLGQ
ncbi:MAG: bifunctional riboflavin kinase/FAD synthetase [Verrucomicrobia bacterium]|nr:bifunctional riboflavin kinase/FAD synthetase [Verrucomicrobiota bacterium]